jgi:hypothetical protein
LYGKANEGAVLAKTTANTKKTKAGTLQEREKISIKFVTIPE